MGRFLLLSLALYAVWPFIEPVYVRVLEGLLIPVLHAMGYGAGVVTGDSLAFQLDITRGSAHILVSPTRENFNSVLLNTITLIALFGATPGIFRPKTVARLAVALLALLFYQVLFSAHVVILALPAPDPENARSFVLPVLVGGRTLVPLLLWLCLHPWALEQMRRLLRHPAAGHEATVKAWTGHPGPRGRT